MKGKQNVRAKIAEYMDLPREAVENLPSIKIIGSSQVEIENHRGIIEYKQEILKIKSTIGIIEVYGENLIIKEISSEDVIIDGVVSKVEIKK